MKRRIFFLGAERPVPRSLMQDVGIRRCGIQYGRIKNKKDSELSDIIGDLKLFEEVMVEPGIPNTVKDRREFLFTYIERMVELNAVGINLLVRLPEFPEDRETNRILYEAGIKAGLRIPYPVDFGMPFPPEDYISMIYQHRLVRTPEHARFRTAELCGKKYHASRLTNMQFYMFHSPDSSDTAAWMNGIRYGMTYLYRGGVIHSYKRDKALRIRSGLWDFCQTNGVDYQDLLDGTKSSYLSEEQIYAVNKTNLIAWHQFAEGE